MNKIRAIANIITEDPDIFVESWIPWRVDLQAVLNLLPANISNLYQQDPEIAYKIDEIISMAEKSGLNPDPAEVSQEIIERLRQLSGDYPGKYQSLQGI